MVPLAEVQANIGSAEIRQYLIDYSSLSRVNVC
jgi:hypothetical protein